MVVRIVWGEFRRRWSGAGVTSECKVKKLAILSLAECMAVRVQTLKLVMGLKYGICLLGRVEEEVAAAAAV